MNTWWIIFVGWAVFQIPFLVMMYRWKPLYSRYPASVTSRLLIPWNSDWKSRVEPSDVLAMKKYRRFLMLYYYGVIVLPIVVLFSWMAYSLKVASYLPNP